MNLEWLRMLRSIEKRRDRDARFFKPTALIAVIDGISDGSLAPSDIDPDLVFERFHLYIKNIFPERATSGWRPFWHLSRDGAWIFENEQRTVGPEDFYAQRKPNSRRELMTKIDRVYVPPATRRYWRDPVALADLRSAAIEMLEADDADCRLVATQLHASGRANSSFSSRILDTSAPAGTEEDEIERFHNNGGQGFSSSQAARRAVEKRAMDLARAELEHQGWLVTDVSLTDSYDLLGERGDEICYVEVKGTTGAGNRVMVTRAEVEFARRNYESMWLIVVNNVELVVGAENEITARGGLLKTIRPWVPTDEDLEAISFFCAVKIE